MKNEIVVRMLGRFPLESYRKPKLKLDERIGLYAKIETGWVDR